MNALRQIIKPKGRFISLELPEEFESNSEVEVIVLPSEKKSKTKNKIDVRSLEGVLSKDKANTKLDIRSLAGKFKNISEKNLEDLENLRNE